MAQYAWSKGWKSAALATDTVIVYFKNVVQAFDARFKQLGGKIVAKETYQSGAGTNVQQRRQPSQRRQGGRDRHLDRGCVRRTVDLDLRTADRWATTHRSSTLGR